jgi:hypothetical protein
MHVHMADTRPHLFGCGLMRVGCLHFLCGLVRKCFIFSHPTGILQKVSKSYNVAESGSCEQLCMC